MSRKSSIARVECPMVRISIEDARDLSGKSWITVYGTLESPSHRISHPLHTFRFQRGLKYFYVVVWKAELHKFSLDSCAVIALQHYHSLLRCPPGGQALFQSVSNFGQGPPSFWQPLYDRYGFSPSAKLDSYGEVGFALVEFFQCAVEVESFTQSCHPGQFRPRISSFRLLPKTCSGSPREAFDTDP